MLIGVSGFYHSGKDEVGRHLERRYGYTRTRFAAELKAACARIFGFSEEQIEGVLKEVPDPRFPLPGFCPACTAACSTDTIVAGWYCEACRRLYPKHLTPRLAMQTMGASMRTLYADVWVEATLRPLDPTERWVVCDVRYPNEAHGIRARGGRVIRMLRGAPESTHPSETALIGRDELFDAVIDNRDCQLEQLYAMVDARMATWGIRAAGETIASEPTWTITPSGLTNVAQSFTASQTTVRLSGGVAGDVYDVLCEVTSSPSGYRDERTDPDPLY